MENVDIVIKEVFFFIMLTIKNMEKMQMFLVRRNAVLQVTEIRKGPTLRNLGLSSVERLRFCKSHVPEISAKRSVHI